MEQNKISRRNFLRVAGASATAAAMGGLAPAASAAGIKDLWSMDLQILATSDTHGKFDPWDYAANKADASGSVAQQATAIKENRTKTTLVVDAGDTIQANSAELFLNDDVHPMIAAQNAIGYDIYVTGNHEYNYGMATLEKVLSQQKAKVLTGNVYSPEGKPLADGYTIINKGGVKIGVIGMVTPNITRWDAKNLEGWTVTNPVDESRKIIDKIKDKVDVILGVMHMDTDNEYGVYGSGLSTVTFGSNTDTRGALYKGSTTSSGKVGSESYSVSTGSNLLKNVCFIAGSTTSKYTVTIPFTASGSSGQMNGQLVVYVNDTHTLNSTGASFRSMGIANELTPDNATGSTYITIDRIVGGKLYSAYTSIKNCTALTSKDLGSTKFYFSGSNSLDSLYVLPLADSKSVEVSYTIDGSTKGTLSFKVNQQTASNQFTDVSGSYKWAANSVDFMYMNDIIKGNNTKNPKLFGPGAKMTRAMLVTVLWRMAGSPAAQGNGGFTDLKAGWYRQAAVWGAQNGIVAGTGAGTFSPDTPVTKEQAAALLVRFARMRGISIPADTAPVYVAECSAWAQADVQAAYAASILDRFPACLAAPQEAATRAELARMLRLLSNLLQKA